jgi:hypothetical protein
MEHKLKNLKGRRHFNFFPELPQSTCCGAFLQQKFSHTRGLNNVCACVRKWPNGEAFCFVCWRLSRYWWLLSEFTSSSRKKGKEYKVKGVRVWQYCQCHGSRRSMTWRFIIAPEVRSVDTGSRCEFKRCADDVVPRYSHAGQQKSACNATPAVPAAGGELVSGDKRCRSASVNKCWTYEDVSCFAWF